MKLEEIIYLDQVQGHNTEINGDISGASLLPPPLIGKNVVMMLNKGEFCRGSQVACAGYAEYFLYGDCVQDGSRYVPDYLEKGGGLLPTFFIRLADEESRKVLAARCKAFLTGNNSYFRISNYPEYFHPLASPQRGDVVIDGGVSADPGATLAFAKAVGKSGKVYSFEPDPAALEALPDSVGQGENIRLESLAFSDYVGATEFCKCDGGASFMVGQSKKIPYTEDVCLVDVTTIDRYVRQMGIPRVDFIKLDIEGAELGALKGATYVIQTWAPKLAICLYHNDDEDAWRIADYINEIMPQYSFWLGHHCLNRLNCVLYAARS